VRRDWNTLVRVPTDLATIAFEAATRALDKQERVLEELRSRTGVLLAASSLAAAFLGRPALDDARDVLAVIALLAFATSIAASVYVLLPKSTFYFALSGQYVFENLYAYRDDTAEIYRRLVYDMQRFWDTNDVVMRRHLLAFRVAAAAVGSRGHLSARSDQRYDSLVMATAQKPTPPPAPPPTPNVGLPETRGSNGSGSK
jgi:hypothetical protein